MLAVLLAVAPYIPAVLEFAGIFIKMFGASAANLQAYADMIEKNKDSGLITVETYERLSAYHKQILEGYEREAKGTTPEKPSGPPNV